MRVDILVLEINGVVILVVLVNTSGDIDSDRSRETLTTVITRGTTHSSAARDEGAVESLGTIQFMRAGVVATTRATHGSTTDLRVPALLPRGSRDIVVLSVRVGGLTETSRGSSKAGKRVNVSVLHLDRVVVLGVLVHGSLNIGDK
jgi:hypothetical protein